MKNNRIIEEQMSDKEHEHALHEFINNYFVHVEKLKVGKIAT